MSQNLTTGTIVNFKVASPRGLISKTGGKVVGEQTDARGITRIKVDLDGKTYSPFASHVTAA